MTVFEFVFGLYSIIISLALTHLLAGLVALRNAERVRFSIPHALWVWSAFVLAVGNWASTWELRLMNAWPSWTVLLLIVVALSQYILCAFVTPESRSETTIDLAAFHERQRGRYGAALIGLAVTSTAFNIAFGQANLYSDWLRDLIITAPASAAALVTISIRAAWAQILAALTLALLASYFLLVASNIG